jgi:hypothetical protein
MSVTEIKAEILQLPPSDMANLAQWLQEVQADAWDRQMAEDVKAGRLDALVARAKAQVAAGQYQPLEPGKPLTP